MTTRGFLSTIFRQGPSYTNLVRAVLYALVPILTLAVEDGYLVEVLYYKPALGQFRLERSGATLADFAGCLLLVLVIPLMLKRRARRDIAAFSVMALAVLISGLYGLSLGASSDYSLFEPSIWKTIVPLFALTLAFSHCFQNAEDRSHFLSWFCGVQVCFALAALIASMVFGHGQPTYFGATVPIFAGSSLVLLNIAYAISLFRLATKFSWRQFAYVTVFALTIMLSLRRSFIVSLVSAPAFYFAVAFCRARSSGKYRAQAILLLLLLCCIAATFISIIGPMGLAPDLVAGRLKSVNLLWALDQSEAVFGTMGHTDDFLDGLETTMGSPLLGKGLAVWFPLPRTGRWQQANVHAGILKIWIKLGLLGVIGYLWIMGRGLRFFWGAVFRGEAGSERLFVIWFALNYILISIYMNTIFFGYKNSLAVAMYLALCTSISEYTLHTETSTPATERLSVSERPLLSRQRSCPG